MVGTIKKVNRQGAGIIAVTDGSLVPYISSDVLSNRGLQPGERVPFSLRIVKGNMFAQNIMSMREQLQPSAR